MGVLTLDDCDIKIQNGDKFKPTGYGCEAARPAKIQNCLSKSIIYFQTMFITIIHPFNRSNILNENDNYDLLLRYELTADGEFEKIFPML